MSGIRVTVKDLETGETQSQDVWNDYVIVCAGSCRVTHVNDFPKSGTQVITVKGRGGERSGSPASEGESA